MAGELSLKTPLTGLVTLVPTNTATDKTITLPATTGTMVVQDGTNTTTVTNLSASSITDSGNLNFTGTGNRITGDFSNATVASRVMFQTNTANASTSIYIIPNGTNTTSQFVAVNNSDPTNASLLQLLALNTDIQLRSGITGSGTFLPMSFWTSGGEKMRLDTSGNVGIGTASPLAKLQVYPTVGAPASSGNLNTGVIFAEGAGGPSLNMGNFNSGGTYYAWIQSAFVNNAAVVQPLVLQQIGGNVGIGTTSPGYKLDVVGSIKASTQVLGPNGSAATPSISSSGETNAGLFFGDNGVSSFLGFSSGGQERGRFDSSGNLLVGTTSLPTNGAILHSYLSISAGLGYKVKPGQSGTLGGNVFNIDWTGSPQLWIDATNIGTITTTSDYRIKKNITAQTTPALERVMQLRPVNYELADYGTLFKADGIIREGFIAHELAEVIPSAVEGERDAENQIQSLRLDALCSVLTKAIQELKTEVDALKGAA